MSTFQGVLDIIQELASFSVKPRIIIIIHLEHDCQLLTFGLVPSYRLMIVKLQRGRACTGIRSGPTVPNVPLDPQQCSIDATAVNN